jgi:hypothetical protein
VGANQVGPNRTLNDIEQRELDERIRELRSLSGEGA